MRSPPTRSRPRSQTGVPRRDQHSRHWGSPGGELPGRAGPLIIGGRRAVTEALRAGRVEGLVVATGTARTRGLRELIEESGRAGVPVRWVARSEIDALGVVNHQGVAATVLHVAELDERALETTPLHSDALVVVLDGIQDPQNFGACARAAEAAGAALLITRTRRAAPLSSAVVRASAGALLHLPTARVPNLPSRGTGSAGPPGPGGGGRGAWDLPTGPGVVRTPGGDPHARPDRVAQRRLGAGGGAVCVRPSPRPGMRLPEPGAVRCHGAGVAQSGSASDL